MEVEELILEMKAVKAEHNSLDLDQILKMFEIQSLHKLTSQLMRLNNK